MKWLSMLWQKRDVEPSSKHVHFDEPNAEAVARRARSFAILEQNGVPYIEHLPYIETDAETHRRTAEEVGLRILCLALVAAKGGGADRGYINNGIEHFDLIDAFTPLEQAFVLDPQPPERDMIQFSWRVEAAQVLGWAVGQVDELAFPTEPCDAAKFVHNLQKQERADFLSVLALRPQGDILDASDLIYRLHWATRNAGIFGAEVPAGLDPSVVMERHWAINWLASYADDPVDWDDVSTDT